MVSSLVLLPASSDALVVPVGGYHRCLYHNFHITQAHASQCQHCRSHVPAWLH